MKPTVKVHDLEFELYLSKEQIQERAHELATSIRSQYQDKHPIFIGILNGSFLFAADLIRATAIDCEVAFLQLSSYAGTTSTGDVTTKIPLTKDIQDRHIILIEDIVDTGNTMAALLPKLKALQPASLALATLLFKPDALVQPDLKIDFIGFSIPDKFVVGYGLDYNQAGRQLDAIYQLKS